MNVFSCLASFCKTPNISTPINVKCVIRRQQWLKARLSVVTVDCWFAFGSDISRETLCCIWLNAFKRYSRVFLEVIVYSLWFCVGRWYQTSGSQLANALVFALQSPSWAPVTHFCGFSFLCPTNRAWRIYTNKYWSQLIISKVCTVDMI